MSDVIEAAAGLAALRDELAGLAARGEAVLLLDTDIRVLWATRAGAVLLGAASPDALMGAPLDPAVLPVAHLRRLAADLAPSPRMRLERLRLTAGRRVVAVTLALRKVELPSGQALLAVALEGPRGLAGSSGAQPLPACLFAPAEAAAEPEPVTVEVLRARCGGRITARFTWQMDADGCFTAVSPELAGLLGDAAAPRPGESLADLAAHGLVDPQGRLAAALAAGATFNRIETLWPVPGADGLLPVLLSASPVLDARRAFGGFAGFGVARLDALAPAPPAAAVIAAAEPSVAVPVAAVAATTTAVAIALAAVGLISPEQDAAEVAREVADQDVAGLAPAGDALEAAPGETGPVDAPDRLVASPDDAEAMVVRKGHPEKHWRDEGHDTDAGAALSPSDVAVSPVDADRDSDEDPVPEPPLILLVADPHPDSGQASTFIVPVIDDSALPDVPQVSAVDAVAPPPPPVAPSTASPPGAAPQPAAGWEPVREPEVARAPAAEPNVVPLRSAPVSPRTMLSGITPSLSRSERHAFREIARALGARVEGDDEAPAGEALQPAAGAAALPDAPPRPDASKVQDGAAEGPASDPPADTPRGPGTADRIASAPVDDLRRHANDDHEPVAIAARPAAAAALPPVAGPDVLDPSARPGGRQPGGPDGRPEVVVAAPEPEQGPGLEPATLAVPASPPALAELVASTLAAGTPGSADVDAPPRDPGAVALLDRLPIGILVSRGEVPIYMNRTLLELLGYEDADTFHREGGIDRLFSGVPAAKDAADDATVMIATRSGETLAVDARLQTIPWNGLPATLMSFRRAADFEQTQLLRAAELDLQRRGAEVGELRTILDTATDGVVILDSAGRIHAINRSGEALFGYDQNEVAGETFITLFAPDSHATALDYLEGLRSNGVASVMNDGREVVGRVRQGGRIPLFMTLGAISEGTERKFCAVLRDITPWKKAESELLEAKRAAEQASSQKSDFLANMSHEIRTPLSAIIGFAEVMIEERFGPVGNERYLEYLRDIHASGGHVISLVNDLLDLSKIEAGRFDLTFVSVDVNEVVSRSVAMMQPQAGSGRVVLRSSLSPRLPGVVADERSLRQIVLNILSNAVKFTDPGGQVIISTTFTDRGEVAIRVRDTGIGMTDKEIETALEPFRQIATARRAGGTGLGLPLTKALVEANRASLTIRSAKDAGTLVEVTFPQTRVLAE
ncbi:MAG: PAS domain-containing sensor histidine kinase [Alsobacter sp.]